MSTESVAESSPEEPTLEMAEASSTSDSRFYTEEDLQKAREQEKSKLYKRIDAMKETVSKLEQESRLRAEAEEARQREIQEQQKAMEAEANKRAEEEMSAKELLEKKEAEWQTKMQEIQQQVEAERALREREAEFAQLMDFRQQLQQQYSDRVAPELLDLIQGDTPEELQKSAEDMAARSARILEQTQEAMQNVRQQTPTARVTMPGSGTENSPSQRAFSPEEIRGMSLAEYQKHRQSLLGGGVDGGGRNRGLFG